MIKLLRVDDRLIHGAVGFSWTKQLSINLIVLANDTIAHDDFQKMTLDIAKPRGTKLIVDTIENACLEIKKHVSDGINVMIITNNIPDAVNVLEKIPEIKSLNLGELKKKIDTVKNLMDAIAVNENDIVLCNKLVSEGYEVELRLIPDGKKTHFQDYKL